MSGERVDWTAATPVSTTNLNAMNTPAGCVMQFAGAVLPAGWLWCDAKTIGKTGSGADYTGDKYRTLYDLIQDTYGGSYDWDAGGKVNLPQSLDRVIIGAGTKALAATGGSETIAEANLPAHTHAITGYAQVETGGSTPGVADNLDGTTVSTRKTALGSTKVNVFSGSIGNTGSGTAYNPPYIALNVIIKY